MRYKVTAVVYQNFMWQVHICYCRNRGEYMNMPMGLYLPSLLMKTMGNFQNQMRPQQTNLGFWISQMMNLQDTTSKTIAPFFKWHFSQLHENVVTYLLSGAHRVDTICWHSHHLPQCSLLWQWSWCRPSSLEMCTASSHWNHLQPLSH